MSIIMSANNVSITCDEKLFKKINKLIDFYTQFTYVKLDRINLLYKTNYSFYYNLFINKHVFILPHMSSFFIDIYQYDFTPLLNDYKHTCFVFIIKILFSPSFKLALGVVLLLGINFIAQTCVKLIASVLIGCNYIMVEMPSIIYLLYSVIRLLLLNIYSLTLINKKLFIVIIILLFSSYANANSTHNFSLDNIYLLLATLGNAVFFLIGIAFDYYSHIISNGETIFYNAIISKVILGTIYLHFILTGVFSSNGLWFYTSTRCENLLLWTIITGVSTILFSLAWYKLSINPANLNFIIINSIFRSIADCTAFNLISWHTYYLWGVWSESVDYHNILAMAIFLPLHLISSMAAISLEVLGDSYSLLYGILYYISFGSICLGINGLYAIITLYITSNLTTIITTSVLSILTISLYPDVYRSIIISHTSDLPQATNNRNYRVRLRANRWYIISSGIRYFILISAFIIASGLLFSFI